MAPAASLVVRVSAQIAEFQSSFKELTKTTANFAKDFEGMATRASAVGTFIGNIASDIAKSIAAGLGSAVKDAVRLSAEFSNAFIGLSSVASAFGSSADEARKAAQSLASDGLIPVKDAASGLKNLLAAGFSLPEATRLMNAFKDSAAFGRQGALSFGDAVRSATEGVKNGNSILVDNAGITKNLSQILKEAGYSAQDLSRASSDAGVRQALFNGILKESAAFAGDAQKATETYTGQIARLGTSYDTMLASLGDAITQNKVVADAIEAVATAVQQLTIYFSDNRRGMDLVSGAVIGLVKSMALGVRVVGEFGIAWNTLNIGIAKAALGIITSITAVTDLFVKMVQTLAKIPGSGIAIASMATPIIELTNLTMAARSAVASLDESIKGNTKDAVAWSSSTEKVARSVEGLASDLEQVRGQTVAFGEAGDKAGVKFGDGIDAGAEKAAKAYKKLLAADIIKQYEEVRKAFVSYQLIILKANEGISEGIGSLSKRSQVELSLITSSVDLWEKYRGLIESVNSQIRIGLDSAPGEQFSGDVLAGIWGKDETAARNRELKKAAEFGQQLSQAIIGAIQGGGDIGRALGAQLGASLGEEIGKKLAKSIGSTVGNALGGMLGPLGALGGSLVGGLFDKMFGKSKERKEVEGWVNSTFGSFNKLQKKLADTFNPKQADAFWRALTQGGKNSVKAMDGITEAFRLHEEAMQNAILPSYADVTAAAERYGLKVTEIGDSLNQLRVTESASQIVKDWDLMAKAGADLNLVAKGMTDEIQALVIESLEWGHALPEAMRPILQKMVDMGLVTDEAGEKLLDLDRIKFEKPLQAAIDGLIVKLDELIGKITNGLGGALRGVPDLNMNVPQLGSGGIVRKPTLALVGESGPEAIVPLGAGGRAMGKTAQPIVVQTYLDGRLVAESTARHLPYVLGRTG